jgi:hypothetical protein
MSKISVKELNRILVTAERSVRLIGVVALDPDWESILPQWVKRAAQNPKFKALVLCESDNLLFSHSVLSDTDRTPNRREFEELKFIRDRASEDLLRLATHHSGNSGTGSSTTDFVTVEIMYLHMPISVVEIDDRIYASLATYELDSHYEEISDSHPWSAVLRTYTATYFDDQIGRKYADAPGQEVLELFDHHRIPRGIFPRSSFYDTDYSHLVVWALIFDRQGRLLIHRRADNAKDNRSMWDKSVGGHVDFAQDVGTSRAVVREVIEELYEDEDSKPELGVWKPSDEEIIYLGEWRPKQRGRHPFQEVRSFEKEWAYFRLRDYQRLYSPREMPDGGMRRLRVIADVFLFVAGPNLTQASLGKLYNSKFKLVDLSELKSVMDRALRNEEVLEFDESRAQPLFTPDLVNIMTGELRAALVDFSQYVKRYIHDGV